MRIAFTVVVLFISAQCVAGQPAKRDRRPNRPPKIESFTTSRSVIELCPFDYGGYLPTSATLEVKATDPNNDNLTYKYSVTSGSIAVNGSTATWDLTKSRLGAQTATVEVADRRGGRVSRTTTVNVVLYGACDPPCTTLTVSCPERINLGEIVEFETIIGGDAPPKPIYLWSHSHGQRIPGQEGSRLKIKAVGLPGDVITATVNVLGLDPACNRQASCKTEIVKSNP